MLASDLTEQHFARLNIIERTCSVVSMLSSLFIILTFAGSKPFRQPIARLVFYASFGNVMSNVATLMARSYVDIPASFGCQFQAFLLQMFIPADAFWALAMACNVYLTFYRKYDAQHLKKMELPYFFICYGVPFAVAITYIFVQNKERGRVYGDAVLWCWIRTSWDIWRIATFYGPVWVIMLVTFSIYIRTGRQIYKKYRQLKSMDTANRPPESQTMTDLPSSSCANKTTQVVITSEIASSTTVVGPATRGTPAPYSVTITSDTPSEHRHDNNNNNADLPSRHRAAPPASDNNNNSDMDTDVEGRRRRRRRATIIGPPVDRRSPSRGRPKKPKGKARKPAVGEANSAAWSYARCAMLFFSALLITWTPSSANRLYSVVYERHVSVGLQYASAFVLPLQGFWNVLIYVLTTRRACRRLVGDLLHCFSARGTTSSELDDDDDDEEEEEDEEEEGPGLCYKSSGESLPRQMEDRPVGRWSRRGDDGDDGDDAADKADAVVMRGIVASHGEPAQVLPQYNERYRKF